MLLVDVSASQDFGTRGQLKSELVAELGATLAFSAIQNNDKVGLILFTDRIERFVPARKGTRHVLRVIRELLYHQPAGRRTDIETALEYLDRVLNRRAVRPAPVASGRRRVGRGGVRGEVPFRPARAAGP